MIETQGCWLMQMWRRGAGSV